MTRYRHTQFGTLMVAILGISLALLWWFIPDDTARVAGGAILLIVLLLFSSLTVDVTPESVRSHFGFGLIRRTIETGRIEDCSKVKNKWWYGWGIRKLPGGWMFNVSGLDAVELRLTNGSVFRIGSDEPEQLLAAISQARQSR